jgi:hypothetical protein
MLKARVLVGLLAAPVLALGAVAPAATAAPLSASARAAHAAPGAPANLTRCDIRFTDCRIIDNTAHPRFIEGDVHNMDLIGSTGGTFYTAALVSGFTNVYEIGNSTFTLCWNLDTRNGDHIALDSCAGTLNEEWIISPQFDPNHDSTIANVALNRTQPSAVNCCEPESAMQDPSAIRFLTSVPGDGTSSWYWVD